MINLKLRLQNRATLAALVAAIVAFCYQVAGIFGVVPPVAQSDVINMVGVLLTILASLGIITDPTTKGIGDSTRALEYDAPIASSGKAPDEGEL